MASSDDVVANAILQTLASPNVSDSNGEVANVVDVLSSLAYSTKRIAEAIVAPAMPGTDATGGHVECLVEAAMGITEGLVRIADSLSDVAAAIRETKE